MNVSSVTKKKNADLHTVKGCDEMELEAVELLTTDRLPAIVAILSSAAKR